MKFFILFTTLLLSLSSYSKNYDGYIIKLKKNPESFLNFLSNVGKVERLRVKNHYFYTLSDQGLNKSNLETIRNHPLVEYIEPNYYYHLDTPVDIQWGREITEKKGFLKQWNLLNRGKRQRGREINYKEGMDISAMKAWEITQGKKDVIIAVIDTGITYNHPDIKENVWINEAEKNGQPGVDDDQNGYVDDIYGWDFARKISDPIDNEWGHGTHVAGIIAAKHNERGIKGIMNQARVMALKIFNKKAEGEARSPTSGIIESFYYAIDNGVQIINASWGGGDFSQALLDAMRDLAKNNIIFVTTAGNHKRNNDETPYYPAGYDSDNIVVVGAYTGAGQKAYFSGYGKNSVDIWAPGTNVLSLYKTNPVGDFTYTEMSGTSMAAPHVAAILGMAKSINPGLDYRQAIQALMDASIDEDHFRDLSRYGRADAEKLLNNLAK